MTGRVGKIYQRIKPTSCFASQSLFPDCLWYLSKISINLHQMKAPTWEKTQEKRELEKQRKPRRIKSKKQISRKEKKNSIRCRRAAVLVHLSRASKDNKRDMSIAENSDLLGLLHDPISPLWVGHLPVAWVLDPLDLNLPSPHLSPNQTLFFSLSLLPPLPGEMI